MYLVGVGNFSHLSPLAIVELILFTFPLNFYLYGLNDMYDGKSDRINDRKKGAQGIVARDTEILFLKSTVWVPPAAFIVAAFSSGNGMHVALAGLFLVLSFTYSHPWTRIKEIPVLDCLNSAAIYTIPGLIAYSLHAPLSILSPAVFFIVLPYMGVHAMTTLVDEDVDRKAGMTTIGVAFGKRATTLFAIILFAIGAYALREYVVLLSVLLISIFLEIVFLVSHGSDEKYFRFAIGAVLLAFEMVSMVSLVLQMNL